MGEELQVSAEHFETTGLLHYLSRMKNEPLLMGMQDSTIQLFKMWGSVKTKLLMDQVLMGPEAAAWQWW